MTLKHDLIYSQSLMGLSFMVCKQSPKKVYMPLGILSSSGTVDEQSIIKPFNSLDDIGLSNLIL